MRVVREVDISSSVEQNSNTKERHHEGGEGGGHKQFSGRKSREGGGRRRGEASRAKVSRRNVTREVEPITTGELSLTGREIEE